MRHIRYPVIFGFAGVGLCIAAWYALLPRHLSPVHPDATALDTFMAQVRAIQFDERGHLKHRFRAERLTHYARDDIVLIRKPLYTFRDKQGVQWELSANQGRAQLQGERIELFDHVQLQQIDLPPAQRTTLLTSQLTLLLDQSRATTHQPVTLQKPNAVLHAKGMRADLKKGTIQLLSEVQGDYDQKATVSAASPAPGS